MDSNRGYSGRSESRPNPESPGRPESRSNPRHSSIQFDVTGIIYLPLND